MRIAVRLDDIAPVMNWENFDRMMTFLEAQKALPLLGVIPDCQDKKIEGTKGVTSVPEEEFTARMHGWRDKGAEIAMHGVYHVYTTGRGGMFPLGRQSEFAGLPLEEQEELLREGVEKMKKMDLPVENFMAPSHSYDENTLKALETCGFKRVTDGFGSAPYRLGALTFYPLAFSKKHAASSGRPGSATLVFHVNTMSDADLDRARALLEKAELIPYRALLMEPTKRRSPFGQKAEYLMAAGKRLLAGRHR